MLIFENISRSPGILRKHTCEGKYTLKSKNSIPRFSNSKIFGLKSQRPGIFITGFGMPQKSPPEVTYVKNSSKTCDDPKYISERWSEIFRKLKNNLLIWAFQLSTRYKIMSTLVCKDVWLSPAWLNPKKKSKNISPTGQNGETKRFSWFDRFMKRSSGLFKRNGERFRSKSGVLSFRKNWKV